MSTACVDRWRGCQPPVWVAGGDVNRLCTYCVSLYVSLSSVHYWCFVPSTTGAFGELFVVVFDEGDFRPDFLPLSLCA